MKKETGVLMSLNLEAIKIKNSSTISEDLGKSPWQEPKY